MAASLPHFVHAISLVTFIKLTLGRKHRNALGVGWSGVGRSSVSVCFISCVSDPKQRQKLTFRRTKVRQSRQHQRLWVGSLGQLVIAGSQQQASKDGQYTEGLLMFAWCQSVTPFKKHVKQFYRHLSLYVFMHLSPAELIKCSLSFPSDTPTLLTRTLSTLWSCRPDSFTTAAAVASAELPAEEGKY